MSHVPLAMIFAAKQVVNNSKYLASPLSLVEYESTFIFVNDNDFATCMGSVLSAMFSPISIARLH